MTLINEISRIRQVMGLNEQVETKGVQFDSSEKKTIDDFVEFVKKELGIKNEVDVQLQNNKDGIKTTAVYKYQDEGDEDFEQSEIRVFALGRALVDVLRSIAHEMVHHHQNEEGELKGKHSNVGGPIEDEANAVAGEMIKAYGLEHPEIYPEGVETEMGEQEEGGDTGGNGGGDSSATNANVSTWETGITRGPANTLTIIVWDSGVSRGKGNSIDQNSKWESGASRGKANPLT
jgi:hypothetical protein